MMNFKIWIGKDPKRRKITLSMLDIEKHGGKNYFRGCTDIYIYNDPNHDIRCNKENDRENFEHHKNKEIHILY